MISNILFENINPQNLGEWVFILISINIYIYIFSLFFFFSLFFLIDPSVFKTTANLKIFAKFQFTFSSSVFILLSLAGMPPFISFVGKFFLFVFLFFSGNVILIVFFFLFNCFVIYFYIQHLRLLITKVSIYSGFFKNFYFYWNFSLTIIIIWLFFFLIFGVFFLSDMYVFLSPLLVML